MKFSLKQSLLAIFALTILFTARATYAEIAVLGQTDELIECADSEDLGIFIAAVSNHPDGELTFQWYRNDVLLDGETSEDLEFEVFDHTITGIYRCLITETITIESDEDAGDEFGDDAGDEFDGDFDGDFGDDAGAGDGDEESNIELIVHHYWSNPIPVYVLTTPLITEHPKSVLVDPTAKESHSFTFKAHYNITVPQFYQDYITWYKMELDETTGNLVQVEVKKDDRVGGTKSSIFTIREIDETHICKKGEYYFVEIEAQCGTLRSEPFTISEKAQAVFAMDPQDTKTCPNEDICLKVEVQKPADKVVEYLWYKDNTALTDGIKYNGTTTAKLQITDIQEAESGVYTCEINLVGDTEKVVSMPAMVDVIDVPEAVAVGDKNIKAVMKDDVTMKVNYVSGAKPLTVEWEYDGVVIKEGTWSETEGAKLLTLLLKEVDVYEGGEYICRITNDCDKVEVIFNLTVAKWDDGIASVIDAEEISFNVVDNNISFNLKESSNVTVTVYDINGTAVATVFDGVANIGNNLVTFDNSNLTSGVYFYTLTTNEFYSVRKVSILK